MTPARKRRGKETGKRTGTGGRRAGEASSLERLSAILRDRTAAIASRQFDLLQKRLEKDGFEALSADHEKSQTQALFAALADDCDAATRAATASELPLPATTSILREISRQHAEQGLTPSQTAITIFGLKDAILPELQREFGDVPLDLAREVMNLNVLLDRMGLVTFETYSLTREELIRRQSRAMLELSTPVIQLWDELLLLPLVGILDTLRAVQILEQLLPAIVRSEARAVILDVTGVPVIDTRVAQHLLKTVTAARMLGSEVIVTGISPEAAQTLTKLAVDLSTLITRGTLRAGLTEALSLLGRRVAEV